MRFAQGCGPAWQPSDRGKFARANAATSLQPFGHARGRAKLLGTAKQFDGLRQKAPAAVSVALWPLRSKSGCPKDISSSTSRFDREDTVRCTRSAAVAKLAQVAAQ